jgi:hypothetical protein
LKRRGAREILSRVLKKEQDLWTSESVCPGEGVARVSCITDWIQAKRKEFTEWVRERDTVVQG